MSKTKNNIKVKATKLVHILMDNGGVGSGNWGHKGRPGLVGGSAKGSGGRHNSTSGLFRYLFSVKKPMTSSGMEKLFGKAESFSDYDVPERLEVNPNYDKGREYQTNCQLVVPTLEASMRGYRVKAKQKVSISDSDKIQNNYSWLLGYSTVQTKMFCEDHWDGADGKPAKDAKGEATHRRPRMTKSGWRLSPWTKKQKDDLQKHIEAYPEMSRIQISFNYSNRRAGHTTMLQRVPRDVDPNGWVILEGQSKPPEAIPSTNYFNNKYLITMLRVDDKPLNAAFVEGVMERRG